MNSYVKPKLTAMTRQEFLRELDRKVEAAVITAAERDRVVRELVDVPRRAVG